MLMGALIRNQETQVYLVLQGSSCICRGLTSNPRDIRASTLRDLVLSSLDTYSGVAVELVHLRAINKKVSPIYIPPRDGCLRL